MEALLFVLANLFMGVIMIWVAIEDSKGEKGGRSGWFAFRPPLDQNTASATDDPAKPEKANRYRRFRR